MEREALNFYLQHVPDNQLLELCEIIIGEAKVETVRQPTAQTVLVPVKDPINEGTFFGGEVLVTSSVVKVNSVPGWAMVMDENRDQAACIALLDAAYGAGVRKEEIEVLAGQGRNSFDRQRSRKNASANETRVSFDLL